jgi:hypothetical protein
VEGGQNTWAFELKGNFPLGFFSSPTASLALTSSCPPPPLLQFEEQLEDCRKFKEFLDSITPLEFFEAQVWAPSSALNPKNSKPYKPSVLCVLREPCVMCLRVLSLGAPAALPAALCPWM